MLIRESDGQPLDMVKKDWNPVQNDEAFDFFEEFVEAGDMTMETAGSLQDGKRVFALAKINEDFEIGGDKIEGYLLFTNPHIYGRAVDIRFTPVRVVCNNTLTLSLGQKSDYQVSMTHKKAFDPNEAKKLLGIASEKLASYKEMAEFLIAKRYTDNSLREYYATVFPAHKAKQSPRAIAENIEIFDKAASRNAKRAYDIVDIQPGAKLHPGTMWNAFNAVTYLTDHELGRSQDSRLASAWYGLNKVKKVKALETALAFAESA